MNNQINNEHFIALESNSIRRNLSGLIDATIILIVTTFLLFLVPNMSAQLSLVPCILILGFYRLLFLYFFKATIGMMVCGINLLNESLEDLSFKEKALASFFILYKGVDYYKQKAEIINH